jgi:hypothetical protein
MKWLGLLVLSVALAGLGCLPHSFVRDDQKPPKVEMKEPVPPPVQPDGITAKNAEQMEQKLRAEMVYEQNHLSARTPASGPDKQE